MALVVTFAISAVLSPRWSAAHQVESSAEKKRERGPGDERRAFEAALATELEFEWAKAIVAEVERDTSERPRPGWVIPTLRLYLTLPYAERPRHNIRLF